MEGNVIAVYSKEKCYTLISEAPQIPVEDTYNSVSEEDESSSYPEKWNKKHYLKINILCQCHLFLHSLFQSWLN